MKRKQLKTGICAYYWEPKASDRNSGFSLPPEALGTDFGRACERAKLLNEYLDDWRKGRGLPSHISQHTRSGTVDWWVELYTRSSAFAKCAKRTQSDYRKALAKLCDLATRVSDGDRKLRVGELPVSSLSPRAVDKIYEKLRDGGRVTRQANTVVEVARRAWAVVARQHPGVFLITVDGPDGRKPMPLNPWIGVERIISRGTTKPATRAEAYLLARALADLGHPSLGIVALVAFEWLQRPENTIAGHLCWTQYRPANRPNDVEIYHHKTEQRIWLALEHSDTHGSAAPLYPELEASLRQLPRLGIPVVMFVPQRGNRTPRLYSESYADHLVQRARVHAGLPPHVTLAACRHGGMTELGDAGLTEQGVMALSAHRTPAAARLYVKRTQLQRLNAAVQRRRFVDDQS